MVLPFKCDNLRPIWQDFAHKFATDLRVKILSKFGSNTKINILHQAGDFTQKDAKNPRNTRQALQISPLSTKTHST